MTIDVKNAMDETVATYPDPHAEPDLQALLAFRSALLAIEVVHKSQVADTGKYKYSYANLSDVLEEVKRVCEMFQLAVTQTPTAKDGLLYVGTTLIHLSGGVYQPDPIALPLPKEAQALGSAITYLRRYSLVTIFGIPVEDDDGAAATKEVRAPDQYGGYRSGAEERIHAEFTKLAQDGEDDVGKRVRENFRAFFNTGLSELPTSRHGEALEWVLNAIPEARVELKAEEADKVDKDDEEGRGYDG